jgi:pimeloyl-[acyl-carrier protein] synthase
MKVPAAIDFAMTDHVAIGPQLLDRLLALRSAGPILWSEQQNAWLVTSNEAVAEAFKGELPLSSGRFERLLGFIPEAERWRIETVRRIFPTFVVNMDPPVHTRLRRLLMRAFSRRVSESYRPFVQANIDRVLDEAALKNQVEFVEEVARQVPGRLILELLGLSQDDYPELQRWTNSISVALGGGAPTLDMLDRVEETFKEMETLFSAEIRRREETPTDDFISSLMAPDEEGDRLTHDEVLGACFLTLSAGNNSTTNTLSLGTAALARHPQARAELLAKPEMIDGAMMELMRFIAMSTNQVRLVTADFEWRGHPLKKGQMVSLLVAGANHDPAVFPQPEQLDFHRGQAANMTFAPGMHFCVGHFLARMQLTEFFTRLLTRFPNLEVLDEDLHWSTAFNFRGLKSLNVRLAPR